MKLTETIREKLKASGASRNKVHLATGLTRATVAAFLDGKDVHSSTLDAIGEFLGVTVDFKEEDNKPPRRANKTERNI